MLSTYCYMTYNDCISIWWRLNLNLLRNRVTCKHIIQKPIESVQNTKNWNFCISSNKGQKTLSKWAFFWLNGSQWTKWHARSRIIGGGGCTVAPSGPRTTSSSLLWTIIFEEKNNILRTCRWIPFLCSALWQHQKVSWLKYLIWTFSWRTQNLWSL